VEVKTRNWRESAKPLAGTLSAFVDSENNDLTIRLTIFFKVAQD
jgi:hypothetical protein